MKPSERRKQYSEALAKRTQESYNSKDDSGKYKSIFESSKMKDVIKWKPAQDDHSINIIPYIAGDNNPKFPKGTIAYYLDIFIHRAIGVNEDSFICLNRSFGKPCPICEYIADAKKSEDYDEEYIKTLYPTRRAIYNIEVLDTPKEIAKGIQLWDVSHFLFEKELAELAKKKQGGGFVYFSDPDQGRIVSFRKKGEGMATKYPALSFEERSKPISDELLDKAICIEEKLHVPDYEEVANAFFGKEKEESAPPTEHVEEERNATTQDDRNADVPEFKEDECPCEQTFGTDFNQFENCDDCVNRAGCEAQFLLIQEKEKKEKEKAKPKAPVTPTPRKRETQAPAAPAEPRRRVRS